MYWQRNLSQYHFVHHKSHMDWSAVNLGSVVTGLSHGTIHGD